MKNEMNHVCASECDLVLALTDREAENHKAAGDRVGGKLGRQYLIIEGYEHLPKFSIKQAEAK